MNYGKLIDGEIVPAPTICKRADGTTVIGYHTRVDLLREDGWLPIITVPPPGLYYSPSWVDTGTEIRQKWTPYDPPPPPPYVEPQPLPMQAGVEVPVLVLTSPGGYKYGLAVDDKGNRFWYRHSTPEDGPVPVPAEEIARRVAAATAAQATKAEADKALLVALAGDDKEAIKRAATAATEASVAVDAGAAEEPIIP